MTGKLKDYSGKKFGILTALEFHSRKDGRTYWKFKCDCGNYCVKAIGRCVNGDTKSCGCLQQQVYKYQNPKVGKQCKVLTSYQVDLIKKKISRGKTKKAIAEKLGISRTTLNSYLTKKTKPRDSTKNCLLKKQNN